MSQPWISNVWESNFSLSSYFSKYKPNSKPRKSGNDNTISKPSTLDEQQREDNEESIDNTVNINNHGNFLMWWFRQSGDDALCDNNGKYSWNLASHFKHC